MRSALLLTMLCPLGLAAQPSTALWMAWQAADHDTIKARLAEEIAWEYCELNWDSTAIFARLAIHLGTKSHLPRTTAYALNDLSGYYAAKGEPDSALACLQQSMQLRRLGGNKEDIASGYNLIGAHYHNQGAHALAIAALTQGLQELSMENAPSLQAKLYDNLGRAYSGIGDYAKAMQALQMALTLNMRSGDALAVAKSEHNIGVFLHETHRPEAAWEYYERAAAGYSALGNPTGAADILGNQAMIWRERGYQDSALSCLKRSLVLLKGIGDVLRIHTCYNNMALVYEAQGQLAEAEHYQQLDLDFCAEHGLTERERVAALNLGLLVLGQGRSQAALNLADRATRLGPMPAELRLTLYDIRSRAYAGLHDYETGLLWLGRHRVLQDSLSALQADVQNLTDKYLAERASGEKAMQQATTNAALLAQSRAENRVQAVLIVSIVLLLLLLAILFGVNRSRQQHRLRAKQAELDSANARELSQQRSQEIQSLMQEAEVNALRVTMSAQERERQRIGRNLHDRVGSKLSVVQMLFQNLGTHLVPIPQKIEAQYEMAVRVLDETCDEVREIARNMTSNDLAAYGFQIALERFCEQVQSSSNRLQVKVTIVGIPIQMPPATEQELYSVVRTLVENVLKHAEATDLQLTLTFHENGLSLEITDNGKGFALEDRHAAPGIGLRNAQERTAQLAGTMFIDTAHTQGCRIHIDIPLTQERNGNTPH